VAQILCGAGPYGSSAPWKVADVAEVPGTTSRTIENLKVGFVDKSLDAALERPRQASPRNITLAYKVVELKIASSVPIVTVQQALKYESLSRLRKYLLLKFALDTIVSSAPTAGRDCGRQFVHHTNRHSRHSGMRAGIVRS